MKESAGSDGGCLTAEERERLEKSIKDQERLMEGYQKVSVARSHPRPLPC